MRTALLALAIGVGYATTAIAEPSPALAPERSAGAANGAAAQGLNLEAAIRRAMDANPALAAAQRESRAMQALVEQAAVRPNPEISIEVEDERPSAVNTVTLSLPIELGGKREKRVLAAEIEQEVAVRQLAGQVASVRASVMQSFFVVAVAQQKLQVGLEMERIVEQAALLAQRRVDAGKIAPLEADKAALELAQVRMQTRSAALELEQARRNLALWWGQASPDFAFVEASLEVLPVRQEWGALLAALAQSPEREAAGWAMRGAAAQLAVAQSKRFFDPVLSVGVSQEGSGGRSMAKVGISMPWPLFDRNQGNIRAASEYALRAEDVHRELQATQEARLADAVTQFDNAVEAVKAYATSIIPSAEQAYEGARKGFEAGKNSFLEVLDAQRNLSLARIDHLEKLTLVHQAAADISRLTDLP